MQMLLCNRVIDANAAWEWGLAGSIVPSTELDSEALAVTAALAGASATALGQTRRLVRAAAARSLSEHLGDEAVTISRLAGGADARGRIESFTAGRRA